MVTSHGEAALELARELRPAAITLDLRLPDMDGWVVLDRLKHDPATRHIPVHIISVDDSWQRGLKAGGVRLPEEARRPRSRSTTPSPTSRASSSAAVRNLLVVEDNEVERDHIVAAIGDGDVQTTAVGTAAEALEALRAQPFDCLVLDLGLPDMNGLELLEQIKRELAPAGPPRRRLHGQGPDPGGAGPAGGAGRVDIVKDVRSLEHLVDKTALFLHRVEANLRPATRQMLHLGQQADPELAGKKVLIVDDDLRNIFALTSKLERWEMVGPAGRERPAGPGDPASRRPDVDLVLMDIMMPEMDGYETIRAIRAASSRSGRCRSSR